jgi:hypothetical protein
MPYKDPVEKRAASARYRAKHYEDIRARRAGQIDKIRAQARKRYHEDPQKYREAFLQRRYGITQADYDAMLLAQKGCCAVCETDDYVGPGRRAHVDHDHKTGKVRGLICVRCNVLLGMAQDQHERFLAAIRYLKKHAQLTKDELLM